MDSSTDDGLTKRIAETLGARVVSIGKQGLGKAYIDSVDQIKGDYVIMGDADGTYDFMEMDRFTRKMDNGYDFVMGTRLKGDIKPGAMPWSHRYIGTPTLTFFINLFFRAGISDCNSGLRALTIEAFRKMKLESWGWEYASEMVIKGVLCNLKMTEVPVSLTPDRNDRKPHLNPFAAGWSNLRYIMLLASEFIFLKLGAVISILGLIVLLSQLFGPVTLGAHTFGTYYLFLGVILTNIGFSILQMGIITQNFSYLKDFRVNRISNYIRENFRFERGLIIGAGLFLVGFSIDLFVLLQWLSYGVIDTNDFRLGIYALFFIISGIQSIYFSFVFYLFNRYR